MFTTRPATAEQARHFATVAATAPSDTLAAALDAAQTMWMLGVQADDAEAYAHDPHSVYSIGADALLALLRRAYGPEVAAEVRETMADCLESWRYCATNAAERYRVEARALDIEACAAADSNGYFACTILGGCDDCRDLAIQAGDAATLARWTEDLRSATH